MVKTKIDVVKTIIGGIHCMMWYFNTMAGFHMAIQKGDLPLEHGDFPDLC